MLLAFTIACSDGGGEAADEGTPPSAAGDTRPADYSSPPQSGATDQPPALTASGAAGDVILGGGSYCWGSRCVDTIEPTSDVLLSVGPGATVFLSGYDWTQASELVVSARDDAGAPDSFSDLESDISGTDASFVAPSEPGTYAVFVFLRTTDGNDASYGLALEVQ
jgi:hypothetical protein